MQACARLSSAVASKRVVAGFSSPITRSCYRSCRGKAHVAPLSAQEPPPKGHKSITKQERRVRIMEFVHKYRASNDGKFPTITYVRQQVGGSHYKVREIIQELEYNQRKLDNAKAAPVQGTDEFAGIAEFCEHPHMDDNVNDVLISQEHATTSTENMEKTETLRSVGSSHHIEETEADKHDLNTSETCENADGQTLSIKTESGSMKELKNEPSVSLGVEAKSDPRNWQGEKEANKVYLEMEEKFLSADGSTVTDQSGSDNVMKENMRDGKSEPNHQPEESKNMGLFGSLKSFAYGIRNLWKNL